MGCPIKNVYGKRGPVGFEYNYIRRNLRTRISEGFSRVVVEMHSDILIKVIKKRASNKLKQQGGCKLRQLENIQI